MLNRSITLIKSQKMSQIPIRALYQLAYPPFFKLIKVRWHVSIAGRIAQSTRDPQSQCCGPKSCSEFNYYCHLQLIFFVKTTLLHVDFCESELKTLNEKEHSIQLKVNYLHS